MENGFEKKVENAIKKFEGKSVKVTISGIIESKFYMDNLEYEIEEGILVIEDGDNAYLDIDIDDIENLYLEYILNGYALLVFKVGRDMQIEIQVKDDNVISIKDKILKLIEKSEVVEELYRETCGALNNNKFIKEIRPNH